MSASRRDLERNRQPQTEQSTAGEEDQGIHINGFAQIVAMLEVADPQFRESLLRRIAQRDPRLARNLRNDLDG